MDWHRTGTKTKRSLCPNSSFPSSLVKKEKMNMASSLVFFLFLFSATLGFSSAAVYTVGDKQGWTIMGNPNYTAWAAKKTFHVGDTLLFVYNNTFHNVVEVKKSDYDSCTETAAIRTYTTGNDSITIKTAGDHYFLCGFPGHCQIGQKVEIPVAAAKTPAPESGLAPTPTSGLPSASTPTPASAPGSEVTPPSGSGSPGSPAASPKASNAAISQKGLGLVVFTLVIAAASVVAM